jgi:hypothetical protein
LDGVISVVAAEHKQVLHSELLCLRPSDLEPLLLKLSFAFQRLGIKQVKHFFIVNLQKAGVDIYSLCTFRGFGLIKDFFDGSHSEAYISKIVHV